MKLILAQASGSGFGPAVIAFIVIIIVSIIVFLALRQFVLWYWKVDKIIQNQEMQNSLLEQLVWRLKERDEVSR
jgi:hypothetical protein